MVLVLAVLAAGCTDLASNQGSTGSANKKQTAVYDKNGITFNYPTNWKAISPRSLNMYVTDFTYLAVLSNNDTGGRSIVQMVIAETGQSYDEFVASQKAYDQKSGGFVEWSGTVDGTPAIEYTTGGDGKRKSINIYFEKRGKTYYLTLAGDTKNFSQDSADFDTMLNSLHVT